MKALVFGSFPDPMPPMPPDDAPLLEKHLASTPMTLADIDEPEPIGPDWMVLRTRLTGVCGSDAKQVLMDFEHGEDSPMTAFISFPQVLGHEVVATVERLGPEARGFDIGQRVVLNPWLSCAPRGITPECEWCQAGDWSLCANFNDGRLSPGIHTGNAAEATGGFAEYLPAHTQMVIPIPDEVPDDVAVLGDPFSVSLHAITRTPPPAGGRALVYGAGALGTTATAILGALYPSVEVGTIARWDAQATLAERLGARVFRDAGAADLEPRAALIEQLAEWSGGVVRHPWQGLPITHPGGIDVVYDTVGAMETIEVAVRVLRERGSLVQMGVSSMKRCEFTPMYFKELRMVGSNAFGIEEVDGKRQHAIAHYLDLVRDGRIDLTGMLTHRFRLDEWRTAFETIIHQRDTGAIKVAFDFR